MPRQPTLTRTASWERDKSQTGKSFVVWARRGVEISREVSIHHSTAFDPSDVGDVVFSSNDAPTTVPDARETLLQRTTSANNCGEPDDSGEWRAAN